MRAALLLMALAACSEPRVTAMTQDVTHPEYRVRAALPAGWVAEASFASIYPADVWSLHPAATRGPPAVTLLLAWQPRGGRHSASFPGDRADDAHATARTIGGAARSGTAENGDRHMMWDFDVGELAVSVSTIIANETDRAVVDAIVASLVFDPAARPAKASARDPR